MNTAAFTARVTGDVETRETRDGKLIATLRVAIDDRLRDQSKSGLFIDVRAHETLARSCAERLGKGWLIAVHGRFDREEWTTPDGQKRDRLFITANTIDFLRPPGPDGGHRGERSSSGRPPERKPRSKPGDPGARVSGHWRAPDDEVQR